MRLQYVTTQLHISPGEFLPVVISAMISLTHSAAGMNESCLCFEERFECTCMH